METPKQAAHRIVFEVIAERAKEEGPVGDAARAELRYRFNKAIEGFASVKEAFTRAGEIIKKATQRIARAVEETYEI